MTTEPINFNKENLLKYLAFFDLDLDEIVKQITTEKTKEEKKEKIKQSLNNGKIEINFLNKIANFLKIDICQLFFKEFKETPLVLKFKNKNSQIPLTINDNHILRYYQNIREDIAIFDNSTFSNFKNKIEDNVIEVAKEYRNQFQLEGFIQKKKRSENEVFNFLRQKIEEHEIYVFKNNKGDRGQKKGLSKNLQGCIFLDNEFPTLILINNDYPQTAQISTLLHEYAHYLLGIPEIEATENFNKTEIEKWCNRFAYHLMMPIEKEDQEIKENSFNLNRIDLLSQKYFISKASFVVRFKELKIITQKDYSNFFQQYSNFDETPTKKEKKINGGGNFHNTKKERMSKKFLSLISNSLLEGKINRGEFAKYIGIKDQKVKEYLQ